MKEDRIPRETDVFVLAECIGNGSFAIVYRAIEKATDDIIAIKSYRMKEKTRSHFIRAATEIAFLKLVQHPNIIAYVCSDIKKEYMYLGIEYSPYGNLANYIKQQTHVPRIAVQVVMQQLLSALCYLHDMFIFHGDVKPENIIIVEESDLKIKLTDFGLAEVVMPEQGTDKKAGSFFYMAPEIHLGFNVNQKSDLFSAGVVMYEMVYKDKPFPVKITKEEYISLLRKRVAINGQ